MYSQSASTGGTPSDNTSCKNDVLLSDVPFEPVERLNASLMRRSSLSETVQWKTKEKKKTEIYLKFIESRINTVIWCGFVCVCTGIEFNSRKKKLVIIKQNRLIR